MGAALALEAGPELAAGAETATAGEAAGLTESEAAAATPKATPKAKATPKTKAAAAPKAEKKPQAKATPKTKAAAAPKAEKKPQAKATSETANRSEPKPKAQAKGKSKGRVSDALSSLPGNPVAAAKRIPSPLVGGASKVIVAEFIACMVLVGLAPLLNQIDNPGAWLKKGAAVTALFFVLSLIGSGGPKASRIAAAFGGICTLALMINDRDIFAQLAGLFGGGGADAAPAEDIGDINEVLGE